MTTCTKNPIGSNALWDGPDIFSCSRALHLADNKALLLYYILDEVVFETVASIMLFVAAGVLFSLF